MGTTLSACVCVCVCVLVCMCVCLCVSVCVCLCAWILGEGVPFVFRGMYDTWISGSDVNSFCCYGSVTFGIPGGV
jgi:hypothetical protein